MNREIKFRARDEDGKWYYFTLSALAHGAAETTEFCDTELSDWCEFTGLHDKNGKEIFEGDICYAVDIDRLENSDNIPEDCQGREIGRQEFKGPIEYHDGIYFIGEDGTLAMFAGQSDEDHYIEVIGNIYENPELLKA